MRHIFTFLFFLFAINAAHAQIVFNSVDLAGGNSNPGNGHSFFVYNDMMYFAATDSAHGTELWASDGTKTGSNIVADLAPGKDSSNPANFIAYNGKLFFQTISRKRDTLHIWSSDGTAAGTQLVKNISTAADTLIITIANCAFTLCNGKLFFATVSHGIGVELWVCDGTAAGTYLVKDINRSADLYHNSSDPQYLTAFNNKLYFSADDSLHGRELWVSDGTTAGTQMLKDIHPGIYLWPATPILAYNSLLYFFANDSVHGMEPWVTDGTLAGTQMLKNIYAGDTGSIWWGGQNVMLIPYNGLVYFAAVSDTATWLYTTDGTPAGTQPLYHFRKGYWLSKYSVCNGLLYFNGPTDVVFPVQSLWSTDGTAAGTHMIKEMPVGILTPFNGKAYFNGGYDELFETDGTTAGTLQINPATTLTNPLTGYPNELPFTVYHNKMFFPAKYDAIGKELWYIEKDTPVSISKLTKADVMRVYPNPSNDNFTINIASYNASANTMICVFDVTGKMVHCQKVTAATTQLQLGKLPKGTYEVILHQNDAVNSARISIK